MRGDEWWLTMQPYINYIDNFDAKKDYTIEYTYLGSERILTNQLSIRENKLNSTAIYNRESTKFDKSHLVPKGTLTNGKNYIAKIRVKISETTWSDWSPEVPFICLSTPTLSFETLDNKNYIYNDDVMMNIIYRQEQGEKIETYQITLMDQNKVPITLYPVRFPNPATPNTLTERVNGLVKGRLYYIGCRVTTKNGINYFETHEFIPHYVAPSISGVINVSSQPENGQILIQSFLKQLLGTQTKPFIPDADNSEPENYVYLNDEWVVIPPDKPLMYKDLGMAKASDWVAKIWCKNIPNGTFLDFERVNNEPVGMKFIKYDDYITCEKEYLGLKSRTKSNTVIGLGLNEFYLYIKVIEFRVQMTIIPKTQKLTLTVEGGNVRQL